MRDMLYGFYNKHRNYGKVITNARYAGDVVLITSRMIETTGLR